MFSQSKIAILFVILAVAAVQGFAPVAQPRTSTELGAFSFFQKPTEETAAITASETKKFSNPFAKLTKDKPAPAAKKVVAKKAAPKKAVPTKAAIKTVKPAAKKAAPKASGKTFATNDFVVKAPEKKTKLTIYERQCHIN